MKERLAPVPVRRAWLELARAACLGPWRERPAAIAKVWPLLRAHQARVELWAGGRQLSELVLENKRYRLGRDPACELPLAEPGLSRVHAILEKQRPSDREFALEDFNSANGLFHRDRRIRWIQLRDGDAVRLGSPLKGEAPELRYHHPRSPLEQAALLLGVAALAGSSLLVSGMLVAASIGGGSKIRSISGPVKIFSADGRQIDAREGSSTALPSLQSYPLHLRQALMASEEARFGWNSGIDLFGTLRSALLGTGGGSGLTQQVARMVYPEVGRDVSLTRKLRELWVALQLEVGFSKNRILKLYLDRAYLGLGTEGFEQAAQLYFRESASDLDVGQAAFLVGLLPSPNGYSPCNLEDPGAGLERRNLVLKLMHEQGWLSDQALIDAQRRPLNIDPSACRESTFSSYPFFSDYVLGELEGTRFGLDLSSADADGNYAVISTINPKLQQLAQDQLKRFLEGPAAAAGLSQGALITVNTATGDILAYVGGGDYGRSSFDRVQALRQPGSTFKLFPFLAALSAGVKPADAVSCAPLDYVAGCRSGGGSTSVAEGFSRSENVVALRLAERAGLPAVLKLARRLGISTPLDADYNTMLGGRETYLYELARAYAVVANGGRSVPMHGVSRIYDLGICGSIKSLEQCPERGITVPIGEQSRQLLSPEIAATMDELLAGVVQGGTGRAAGLVPDARGKTGTTNNGVDVLFVGYSPASKLLTAIWMGNDDNTPAQAASGALVAELWGRYMQQAATAVPGSG
ncbi:transglycosylase domain-containing protein [Vulcanococcus sp.]|uniref:transglycosylase domain-containing protein n=1 Tax=Vulcanococcus sp. TaxID=2856995 RepID=UPI0025FD4FC8|nr:transglycosylase domain-containing protein [Vulcanococcus sp.]